jgi:hypothetical protein
VIAGERIDTHRGERVVVLLVEQSGDVRRGSQRS